MLFISLFILFIFLDKSINRYKNKLNELEKYEKNVKKSLYFICCSHISNTISI